jgi:hypothetical protein
LLGQIGTLSGSGQLDVPSLQLGQTTNYVVSAIYQVTDTIQTTGSVAGYEETALNSGGTGEMTPMIPVDSTGGDSLLDIAYDGGSKHTMPGATGVDLTNFTVSFLNQAGANVYIIDFSTDPNFRNKVSVSFGSTVASAGGTQTISNTIPINLKTLFKSGTFSGGSTKIYYRIGQRNSIDSPGPYRNDAYNPNPTLYPGGGTYMYSAAFFFFGQ